MIKKKLHHFFSMFQDKRIRFYKLGGNIDQQGKTTYII